MPVTVGISSSGVWQSVFCRSVSAVSPEGPLNYATSPDHNYELVKTVTQFAFEFDKDSSKD